MPPLLSTPPTLWTKSRATNLGFSLLLLATLPASDLRSDTASGGPFSITTQVFSSGGHSSGGTLVLTGTIGEPAVGKLSGETLTLESGFWATILVVPTPGGPSLSIRPTPGSVILSWSPTPAGFVLEETTALGAAWSLVPSGNSTSVEVPLPNSSRFYRLSHP